MKCPNDDSVLVMSERNGIEIDFCPTCRGVWFDRGELDKIIERAGDDRTREPYGEGDRDRDDRGGDDRYRQPKKKRSSFLGELFEFGG